METLDTPVLDNHMHLDPDHGRGIDAVEDFARLGGTHLLVVNKPSWHLGVEADDPEDFREVFERTIEVVDDASEVLDGRAWPVVGVHPGLISRLVDERGFSPEGARELMIGGIDVAAEYVDDGAALALKSGRPHYEVDDAVWDASNAVMKHAFGKGAEVGCAVQLHTEATEDLTEVAEWAESRGLPADRVVKHYAGGRLAGPIPSVMSDKERLEIAAEAVEATETTEAPEAPEMTEVAEAVETTEAGTAGTTAADAPFLMETDFVDEPDRPGAVLGPKTVPRRVRWLLEQGYETAVEVAHVQTPADVYGIDTVGTLDRS